MKKVEPTGLELRLFLSSTFRDLQKEREHLVRKIFPEIRALCRERGVVFTEIDLRWGLTDEEGALGKIIGACLDEVDRCRPYFIGIFGERYGWVPPYAEIYKDPDLLARYPWLEEAAIDGLSIMEMEVAHAVLNDYEGEPDAKANQGALFYARGNNDEQGVAERESRVTAVINRLEEADYPVRSFSSPEELGRLVLADLRLIIERDYSSDDTSPLREMQAYHEAFAVSRRQAYIPDLATLRKLNTFVECGAQLSERSGRTLVIRGPSGLGKSALVAYWAHTYRRRHPETFLVEHFVGVGSGSGDRIDIVRHLMMELRQYIGIEEEIPDDPEALMLLLPDWMARAGERGLIFLLDGVNQLPEGERDLAWFPHHLPENVYAIITSTLPLTLAGYNDEGVDEITLEPLDRQRREGIIVRFLGEYHKGLSSERIARIATAPQSAHPLFLRTLLEELRVHGLHEELDRVIDHYLGAPDSESLFDLVLERIEQDFGREYVRRIMSLLWCSRNGLTDSELLSLTQASRMELNLILTALDYHLLRRGALYGFFHNFLVQAVEVRYLGDQDLRRRTHAEIAAWFSTQPATKRRVAEEPWGWEQAGELERLKGCLVDPEMFPVLRRHDRFGMLRYWRLLEKEFTPVTEYHSLVEAKGGDIDLLLEMSRFFEDWGDMKQAEIYAEKGMAAAATIDDEKRARVQVMDVLYERGKYTELEIASRRALDSSGGYDPAFRLEALQYRLVALAELSRFAEAEESAREIENGFEDARMIGTRIEIYNNLGLLAHQQGKSEVAETWYRKSLDLFRNSPDESPGIHSLVATNLGTLLMNQGRYDEAGRLLEDALEIRIRIFGEKNDQTTVTMKAIGDLKMRTGAFQEAETVYSKALKNMSPEYSDPFLHVALLSSRASLMHRRGRLREAEAEFLNVLALLKDLVGNEHPATAATYRNLGELLCDQGDMERAKEHLSSALDLTLRLYDESHPSIGILKERIAKITLL